MEKKASVIESSVGRLSGCDNFAKYPRQEPKEDMSYRRSHKVDQYFELRDDYETLQHFWNHYKKLTPYIWNYKSTEGVSLESKVEPQVAKWRSCHQVGRPKQAGAKPVQVSKAP